MANIKSAIKRIKRTKKATLRNSMIKSSMKTAIKKYELALTGANQEEAAAALKYAIKKIDMAASKGLLHKNTAARKKSNLTVKFNKAKAQVQ